MDGNFIFEETVIYYKITDNFSEKPRIIHGIERIGRTLRFYDANKEFIGDFRAYGDYDDMQNISPSVAKGYYIKMLNNQE